MSNETNDQKEKTLKENLEAVGQIIVGEIETVGGILTADPITRAEGDYNVEAGNAHQEAAQNLDASDDAEHAEEAE